MKILTDDQFGRALNLSMICTKRKWQFSTEKKIANTIARAQNKEETIQKKEARRDYLKLLKQNQIITAHRIET